MRETKGKKILDLNEKKGKKILGLNEKKDTKTHSFRSNEFLFITYFRLQTLSFY